MYVARSLQLLLFSFLVSTLFAVSVFAAPEDSLVANFEFNGSLVNQVDGSEANAEIGSFRFGKLRSNQWLELDGHRDFVNLGNPLNIGNKVTIVGRYRLNSTATTPWHALFLKNAYCHSSGSFGVMYNKAEGFLRVFNKSCNGIRTTKVQIPEDRWFDFALTYNGKFMALYIDGSQIDRFPYSQSIRDDGDLIVGAHYGKNGENITYHWNGAVDSLRIYSLALNAADLRGLTRPKQSGVQPLLVPDSIDPANSFPGLAGDFLFLTDADLPGGDFLSPKSDRSLRGISVGECSQQCSGNALCNAFTYDAQARWCFLKNSANRPRSYAGAHSGVRLGVNYRLQSLPRVPEDAFELHQDTDFPHGDLAALERVSEPDCLAACWARSDCMAFTYNTSARACFLKGSVAETAFFAGAVSGARRNLDVEEEELGVAGLPNGVNSKANEGEVNLGFEGQVGSIHGDLAAAEPTAQTEGPVVEERAAVQSAFVSESGDNGQEEQVEIRPQSETNTVVNAVASGLDRSKPTGTPALKPIQGTSRRALVVGIDSYQNVADLKKARNDARAISQTLENVGFNVKTLLDADGRSINRSLSQFTRSLRPGDEAVFYFAGHGIEVGGKNYLLPSDIPRVEQGDEIFLTSESISADFVLQSITQSGAAVSILVLDACRDNPFANNVGRSIGGSRGLALMESPKGAFVLYSAGAGQAALDRLGENDQNPNSVFTRSLLPLMSQPGLPLHELARRVRAEVEETAARIGHTQRPAYYDEVTGSFVFHQEQAPVSVDNPVRRTSNTNRDDCRTARNDWEYVKDTGSAPLLTTFITQHSDCRLFSDLAKERLESLSK